MRIVAHGRDDVEQAFGEVNGTVEPFRQRNEYFEVLLSGDVLQVIDLI